MGVKVEDIVLFEMKCKFYYKQYEVTIRKINNVVDVGILGISKKGYILERHKTFTLDPKEFNQKLLFHIQAKIGYIEKMYNNLVEEGVRNDSKIEEFGVM